MRAREFILEAAYDSMIASMRAKYPTHAADIDWAKTYLKRQDRVVWYLNILKKYFENPQILSWIREPHLQSFQEDLEHYLGQNIPAIQNFQFAANLPPQQLIQSLANLEREWREKQRKAAPPTVHPEDKQIFTFPDGTSWWMLDRAYCEEEGRSGAHCGNVVGKHKPAQRILSLRDRGGHVILTFVREPDLTLGEMKAKGNQKPTEQYHPHIMRLLLSNYVDGITGQGYLPEMNFSVFDLDERYLQMLHNHKPQMIENQIAITPTEILRAPDWLKANQKYRAVARNYPGLENLLIDDSVESWQNARDENPELILYAPESLPDYRQLLLEFLNYKDHAPLLLKARKKYRTDFGFLTELLESAPDYIRAVSPEHKQYQQLVKTAAAVDSGILRHVPKEAWNEDIIISALLDTNLDAWILYNLPDHLKTYRVYSAVLASDKSEENVGRIFESIPFGNVTPEQYYELALDAARLGSVSALKRIYEIYSLYTSQQLRKLAETTVTKNPRAIDYIPTRYIDLDLVMLAVEGDGHIVKNLIEMGILSEFTSKEIYDIFYTAVSVTPGAIHWLDINPQFENLSYDQQHQIYYAAVRNSGIVLDGVAHNHQTPDIQMAAVKANGRALEYIRPRDYTYDLIKTAVTNSGNAIQYYDNDNNRITDAQEAELFKLAVENEPHALRFFSTIFKLAPDEYYAVCKAAYNKHGSKVLKWMEPEVRARFED